MRWRNRLLLLAIGALELGVVAAIVWMVSGRADKPQPRATHGEPSVEAPFEPPVAMTSAAATASVAALPAPRPPPPPVATASAAPSDSSLFAGPTPPMPEHVAELDAFFTKPPGSDAWTVEQRRAYVRDAFAALDARDKTLEREAELAEKRGDVEAATRARATLDHLRARRQDLDERFAALLDGGT